MYSNAADEPTTSKWIMRTSTPKKSSVYEFDPGPSTSFDSIITLPSLFNPAGQSSSKPKRRKGSIISMICEAIEAVDNRKNDHTRRLRTLIRKEIAKGLESGLLKRSSVSRKAIGVQGHFIINENYYRRNSRNSVKIPTFQTKNVNKAKKSEAKTSKLIPKSQENQIPQSVLDSIIKTKDTFEEAAQSILQQGSKVLEFATKLMEASNSLVQQNTELLNSEARLRRVEPIQPLHNEEAHVASMQFSQGRNVPQVPLQSSQLGEAGIPPTRSGPGETQMASMQYPQDGQVRVVPLQSPQEAGVAPVQSSQGEARMASMQFPQDGQVRVVPLQSPQEAGVAPVQSSQGEARVASMQFPQDGQVRVVPLQSPQEAGVAPVQSSQGEARVASRQFPQDGQVRVVPLQSPQVEEAGVAPVQSSQGEARVASMQFFSDEQFRVVPLQSHQGVKTRASPMQSGQGEVRVSSMQFPLGRQARVAPMQSSQAGKAVVAPVQSGQGEARQDQMNTNIVEKEQMAPIQYLQSREGVAIENEYQVSTMQFSSSGVNQIIKTHQSQDELLRATRIQSGQIGEARVASVQPFHIWEQSPQNDDLRVDPHSLPVQELNNSPRQVLSDEEHSVQRNLNFSSDSFGVEDEVSNLIQHLEENK